MRLCKALSRLSGADPAGCAAEDELSVTETGKWCDDLVHDFGTLYVDEFEELPLKIKKEATERRVTALSW